MQKESRRDGYEMHQTNESTGIKEVACLSSVYTESVFTANVLGT
jgi:hypothetical protein